MLIMTLMLDNFRRVLTKYRDVRRASLHTMMAAGLVPRMLLVTLLTLPLTTAKAPIPDNFQDDPDYDVLPKGQGSVAVPIILGCVLAGLVVIVWTAYVLVKSKFASRIRGYQSVSTSPQ